MGISPVLKSSTKGFTTFGYLEPPQLMVWKSDFLRGSMRFVRVPPYESGVKLTNFTFSWQNGEFLWDQKCSPHFLNQNEELSKKIGACICIYTRVYANTWQGGLIEPPPPWIGLKSFSELCLLMWIRKLTPKAVEKLQLLHLWDFSPAFLCAPSSMCLSNFDFLNDL